MIVIVWDIGLFYSSNDKVTATSIHQEVVL